MGVLHQRGAFLPDGQASDGREYELRDLCGGVHWVLQYDLVVFGGKEVSLDTARVELR